MSVIDATQAATARPLTPKDFKSDLKPVWCPGCGHYGALNALNRALAEMGLKPHEVATISGIGCSSRLPPYTTTYGFHGVHGRALAMATGLAVARPDLTVVVVGGDGDGLSIGGNHFLHACRRNVNLTYVLMDNQVYGMTKGQPSPTTAADWDSPLNPGGTGTEPINPLVLALAAGANFLARGFTGDPLGSARLIGDALRHPGFSLVQIMSPCPTFVPEQKGWKQAVRADVGPDSADPLTAQAALLADDGLGLGVFYRGHRPVLPAGMSTDAGRVAELQRGFVL